MKTKCNNCEQVFDSDESIPLLYEFESGTVIEEHNLAGKDHGKLIETYHGCNECLTDDYLMDLGD